jgi:hypothetical protein
MAYARLSAQFAVREGQMQRMASSGEDQGPIWQAVAHNEKYDQNISISHKYIFQLCTPESPEKCTGWARYGSKCLRILWSYGSQIRQSWVGEIGYILPGTIIPRSMILLDDS